MRTLHLKKNEDRRLRRGHLWVFSNEVENLGDGFAPGEIVHVKSQNGRFLGTAYVNPHSLICARLLSREGIEVGYPWISACITEARSWRDAFIGGDAYRLLNGEADGFPGLTIDRYADVYVVQATTQGAYRWLDEITGMLRDECGARCVLLRNDTPAVELEGLTRETQVLHGEAPERVAFTLDDVRYEADVLHGQKTGFYLDQRENRRALAPYVRDADVLDLYCYSGAWAIAAVHYGARRAVAVDSSEDAIALGRAHAELNGFQERAELTQAKAEDYLTQAAEEGRQFDVVCLDPPPFARRKADLRKALQKYQSVNAQAIQRLRPGGVLVTSSCSAHVTRDDFEHAIAAAAGKAKRTAQLLEWRGQARDHPVVPAMPETAYLKCAILRVA